MKLKKFIAAASAVTMLGSLAIVLPANAADSNVVSSVSAQVRANDEFVTMNNVAIKTDGADIEMTQRDGTYFGAYYSFDADSFNIPADATVTSVTLTINKYDTFSGIAFNVRPVTISDAANTTAADIFAAVAYAYANATYVTSNTSASGEPVVTDVTSIFDEENDNAFFVNNATVENSKRKLAADATLTISYTTEADATEEPTLAPTAEPTAAPTAAPTAEPTTAPVTAVATVDGVEYDNLKTALEAATDGQTVDVLQSAVLPSRTMISGDVTVTTSNGSTITTANTTPGGILVKSTDNDPVAVVFDGIDIIAGGSNPAIALSCQSVNGTATAGSSVTVKDATVTGKIYHENGRNGGITLDNATATSIYTRHSVGGNGASSVISLTNGSSVDSITYSSENQGNYYRDSVTVDGTSSAASVTDIAVRFYTVTGETEKSYDTLKITSSAGANAVATNSAHGTATKALDTVITGENVSVAIQFINIPYDVEIDSLTLE